jgi:alkaline phosphatase
MSITRRRFLTGTAAAGAVIGAPALSVPAEAATRPRSSARPRRIIHLVSDGMSAGTLACADHLSHHIRHRPLRWIELHQHPHAVLGLMDMRSLNSVVTDSAAAASSWGCGSRVRNGALNMLPDGRELRPLGPLFGEVGWARGLVTTTEITHATPAGFAVSVPDRGQGEAIALQLLERRIEVLLGGARPHFDPVRRQDKRDLRAEFAAWGYQVFQTRAELEHAPLRDRWLGLFASGHLPYTVDRNNSPRLQETVPALAGMTRRALDRLERYGRFLLQVEGGRVDHGAHSSDAPATFLDQIAFDEAIDVALEFQQRHGDTLLVITTDHGNSNPGLNAMGGAYGRSGELLANVTRVKCSFGEIQSRLVKAAGSGAAGEKKSADGRTSRATLNVEPKVLATVLEETTGYRVPTHLAERFTRFLAGENLPQFEQLDSFSAQLGQLLANYFGVGWIGTSHTSDYVPLLALGPGAERFRGFIKNTDVFRHYTDLAAIKHRNPELPLMAESGPSAREVEQLSFA